MWEEYEEDVKITVVKTYNLLKITNYRVRKILHYSQYSHPLILMICPSSIPPSFSCAMNSRVHTHTTNTLTCRNSEAQCSNG